MRNCLVFDLDDTLYSEHEFVLSGFKAVDRYLLDNQGLSGFFGMACELFEAGERGTIFNQYDLISVYRTHEPQLTLYKDAVWAISHFSNTHRLGLITDGYYVAQKKKIQALDLVDKFESIVVSDEFGSEYWKPHKKPYIMTQEKFGTTGADCVYVGDNPQKDFISAKKLGWLTIQVMREDGEYKNASVSEDFRADLEVGSLFELRDVLNKACMVI